MLSGHTALWQHKQFLVRAVEIAPVFTVHVYIYIYTHMDRVTLETPHSLQINTLSRNKTLRRNKDSFMTLSRIHDIPCRVSFFAPSPGLLSLLQIRLCTVSASTFQGLTGELKGNGWYYGSDALRSPIDRYRAPGDPPYEGP